MSCQNCQELRKLAEEALSQVEAMKAVIARMAKKQERLIRRNEKFRFKDEARRNGEG